MTKIGHPVFLLIGLIFLFSPQACRTYTEIEVNGPPQEKLDILLFPSHYYLQNPEKWFTDALAMKERLLMHPFWNRNRQKINFYRLNDYLADDFHDQDGNWVPDQEKIKDFAVKNCSFLNFEQGDQVIFVVDSDGLAKDPKRTQGIGHTRGDPGLTQIESNFPNILAHEFGHAFGHLGDEYGLKIIKPDWVSPDPNTASDQPGDKCEDKWRDLMGIVIATPNVWTAGEEARSSRIVRCFKNVAEGFTINAYRPTNASCVMYEGGDEFPYCPVCQRQLERRLSKFTTHDNDLYNRTMTFQNVLDFQKATGTLYTVNFDKAAVYQIGKGPVKGEPARLILDINATAPGVPALKYFNFDTPGGVLFTSGLILKQPPDSNIDTPPNILTISQEEKLPERTGVAGYFRGRICAVGIWNTGGTVLQLDAYNAAFDVIGQVASLPDPKTINFIGVRTKEPIYRFEIKAPSEARFTVDDLYFASCPK